MDTYLHILVEKSIFLQKKARKHKFYMLFFSCGAMLLGSVIFNMDMYEWGRPPNQWHNNSKDKCDIQVGGYSALFEKSIINVPQMIGMKSTFLESAILVCVPAMVFATPFALLLDKDGDLLKWNVSRKILFTRLSIMFSLIMPLDIFLS